MEAISDTIVIRTESANQTRILGSLLPDLLYNPGTTIGLIGELGSGKTAVVQGLAGRLGIQDIQSPTYAIAMTHEIHDFEMLTGQILEHFDLYRLTNSDAASILEQYDDPYGIRCIEWVDRTEIDLDILVRFGQSAAHTRTITIDFRDIHIPTDQEIDRFRTTVRLPDHIIAHCEAVAVMAATLSDQLISSGIPVRKHAVIAAAKLHDLLRFIDFKPGGSHMDIEISTETQNLWNEISTTYQHMGHEEACAQYMRTHGYPEIGTMIEPHGLTHKDTPPTTIEQKVLFYADKRTCMTDHVSVEERFADFQKRYPDHPNRDRWYKEVKKIEGELLSRSSTESAHPREPIEPPLC